MGAGTFFGGAGRLGSWKGVRPHLESAWQQGRALAVKEARAFDDKLAAAVAGDTRTRRYIGGKKGKVLSLVEPEDVEFAIDKNGILRISVVEADRARADGYFNPESDVKVPVDGGVGFPIGAGEVGRVSWANTTSEIADRLQSRGEASRELYGVDPLTVATLNTESNGLNSLHGSRILRAELEAAVRRGALSKKEALELFNDTLKTYIGEDVRIANSFADIERTLAPDQISFPKRGQIVRSLFSPQKQYGLPSWAEASKYRNEPALEGLPNGTIAAAMRVDPATHGSAEQFGVRPHAAYEELIGGIGLGSLNLTDPVTLFDLYPEYVTPRMLQILSEGRTITPSGFTNALNRGLVRSKGEKSILSVPKTKIGGLFPHETQARVAPRGLASPQKGGAR